MPPTRPPWQTALQSAADWVQQSDPELPDEIRDRLNAAIEAWWASLPGGQQKAAG